VKCEAADAQSLHSLGLSADSALVSSIRQCVVKLASNTGVVSSVQTLAQSLLSNCWPILLPTTSERITALSALLPLIANTGIIFIIMSPLRRHIFVCFMAKSTFLGGFSALAP